MLLNLQILIMELVLLGELANLNKEDNKVYFAIYNKDSNLIFEHNILVEPNEREKMKRFVSDIVLEELWNILTKN